MSRTLALACLALLGACSAKVTADITVDGSPFKVKECRSGRAHGFGGIQLTDESGRRLRLVVVPDGTTTAVLFPPGAETGDALGPCGTLSVAGQSSKINGITNLKGKADLSCAGDKHKVSGTIAFENCH